MTDICICIYSLTNTRRLAHAFCLELLCCYHEISVGLLFINWHKCARQSLKDTVCMWHSTCERENTVCSIFYPARRNTHSVRKLPLQKLFHIPLHMYIYVCIMCIVSNTTFTAYDVKGSLRVLTLAFLLSFFDSVLNLKSLRADLCTLIYIYIWCSAKSLHDKLMVIGWLATEVTNEVQ